MRGRIANTEVNKSRPCDRDGALSSEGAVCEGLLGGNRGLSVQVKSRGSEKGRRQMEIYRESRRKAGGERKKRKRKRKWIKKKVKGGKFKMRSIKKVGVPLMPSSSCISFTFFLRGKNK